MIDLDVSLLVQIISILALMAILNSILYKPIRRVLEEREARMSAIQGDAEKYERNANQLLESFNQKLAEARSAGQAAREKFKQEGRDKERQLIEASTEEAEGTKGQLLQELSAETDAARKELTAKAEAFSVEIAQKLLGRAV
jgi:F-type H+-transporting ATPase subunit b